MLKSVLIAAMVGAILLWMYEHTVGQTCATDTTSGLLPGAAVGAGVQFILRITEVS